MKSLPLTRAEHKRLESTFKSWLSLTGYAKTSVYNMANAVREFLHYLEQNNKEIETLNVQAIEDYFHYLKNRKKAKRTGALSDNYLKKHLQAIKKFSTYLRLTEQGNFETDLVLKSKRKVPLVLSKEEIKLLQDQISDDLLGIRDRAMFAVFYGAGLRRNEVVNLNVEDFQKERKLLFVSHGKNYKERYVPLSNSIIEEIGDYLQIRSKTEDKALFLNTSKERLSGQSHRNRFKHLVEKAGLEKDASLHTLRHSIATHLHQGGMALESVAQFLGHDSLESTQIYTHLANV